MLAVTIDTGTTNTRVTLWRNKEPICIKKEETGVRVTSIEGTNEKLLKAIRKCLVAVLEESGKQESEIDVILASGMIGSELGICEIPRKKAPASSKALSESCVYKNIPEVSKILPICFIPGVQNDDTIRSLDKCEMMDIMRGEEVEVFAALDRLGMNGPAVLILPGSHTKIVYLNDKNEITGCVTTMAGEILMELTKSSILSGSLQSCFAEEIEEEWLKAGAHEAEKTGLNRTAFLVRILNLFSDATVNQKANYLLGAVIAFDLEALKNSKVGKIEPGCRFMITGNNTYSKGLEILLREQYDMEIKRLDEGLQENLAGYGAILVWKQRARIKG